MFLLSFATSLTYRAQFLVEVASQFNCLEMNEPGARPEDGVTRYYSDATQGLADLVASGVVYDRHPKRIGQIVEEGLEAVTVLLDPCGSYVCFHLRHVL